MRFVEAEESAKYSLSDRKLFDSVSGVSSFKRQQGGVVKNEGNPPVNANPFFCKKCKPSTSITPLGGYAQLMTINSVNSASERDT